MLKAIITYWFKRSGWTFSGSIPKRVKKSVFVVAPNTSRYDFLLGVAVSHITKFRVRILVDKKYFRFPFKALLNSLGGEAYDPAHPRETESYWVNKFNERQKCAVVFTPEQSLARNDDWDTSFYGVAQKTESPIVLVALDYRKKQVKFHSMFYVTGNKERDLDFMRNWFSTYAGKHPEQGVYRLYHSVDAVRHSHE